MKHRIQMALTACITVLLLTSQSAFAHDPAEHAKEAAAAKAKPNCTAMKSMDMSMNDPVMQAMQKKCAAVTKDEHIDHSNMKGMDHSNMKGMDHMSMAATDAVPTQTAERAPLMRLANAI